MCKFVKRTVYVFIGCLCGSGIKHDTARKWGRKQVIEILIISTLQAKKIEFEIGRRGERVFCYVEEAAV